MRYIPHASDEAVIQYVRAMALEIEELAEKNPEVCYRFLFPDRYGSTDVTQYINAETQRVDLAALAEVIRTAAEQPQPVPNGETGDALLKKLMNNFYASQGDDAYLLQDPFAPGVDKKKVSKLIASLYREALNLPQEESGLVAAAHAVCEESSDLPFPLVLPPPPILDNPLDLRPFRLVRSLQIHNAEEIL